MNRTGKIVAVCVILAIVIVSIVVAVVFLKKDDEGNDAVKIDNKGAVASDSSICNAVGML